MTTPADYKAHSLSVSDIVVLHEDGENSAHFVDSFGFTELPKFMLTLEGKENEIQTELAVHIADRYILMHECDEGYDYSILNEQYHLLDGGVYDNPDITIQRAMDMVIADLQEPTFFSCDRAVLPGRVFAGRSVCGFGGGDRQILRSFPKKRRKWNGQIWQHGRHELSREQSGCGCRFPGKDRGAVFTAWTGRVRRILKRRCMPMCSRRLTSTVWMRQIVDVVVAGSRCRGMEQENSDLDVVVEYTGSTREDDLVQYAP